MYIMQLKTGVVVFEWDTGNLDKSYEKHGVTAKEVEEVFVAKGSYVVPDLKHSQKEARFIILGKNNDGVNLFVVFTFRGEKIRVISARRMHKKEVVSYEKTKKNTKV